MCVLAGALLPPLHEMSEQRLSAHMIQHELLMAVAAPLLVCGRPLVVALWSMPHAWRKPIGRLLNASSVRRTRVVLTEPFAAWAIHGLAIWLWHLPWLFDAAVRSDVVHVLQHASFLGTGVLFWSSVIHPVRRATRGVTIISLFTTAVHTSVLGAMMTFARAPWYDVYAIRFSTVSALADQQLAGMIMWIPASLAYLIAALAVMHRWLADSDLESPRPHLGMT
jgi:putative membrane protein